jgi:hypothetical protein
MVQQYAYVARRLQETKGEKVNTEILLSLLLGLVLGALVAADITLRATRQPQRIFTIYDIPREKLGRVSVMQAKYNRGWHCIAIAKNGVSGRYDVVFGCG